MKRSLLLCTGLLVPFSLFPVSLVQKMTTILANESGQVGFAVFMDFCAGLFESYQMTGKYPTLEMLEEVIDEQMKDTNSIGLARRERWLQFLKENPFIMRYFMESAATGVGMYRMEEYGAMSLCVVQATDGIIRLWEKIKRSKRPY